MKINWTVRFKNAAFLVPFVTAIVAFVYQILGLFGVVPLVTEGTVMQLITTVINMLITIGIVVDPTTKGLNDSPQAMTYSNFK